MFYKGIDNNMGVPSNLDYDMALEEHRRDTNSCQVGYNVLNWMSITSSKSNRGSPLMVLLVDALVEIPMVSVQSMPK